jgi:DNA modification methylase
VRQDRQIGLEATLAEYVQTLVAVFRDVRRVLRDDGVLWLNLGDSYANDTKWGGSSGGKHVSALHGESGIGRGKKDTGLKGKDLMMVPARVALALQDDGWYLRSDVIWHKPNPMPESVTDRPTSAHEHIYLLTKRSRYYYDADAIREPHTSKEQFEKSWGGAVPHWTERPNNGETGRPGGGIYAMGFAEGGRNCRNVWTMATAPYKEAHFATFPPELPRRCILAGSKPGDTVLDPFAGAGTALLVADQLGRDAIGVELNPEYAALIERRVKDNAPMFVEIETVPMPVQAGLL